MMNDDLLERTATRTEKQRINIATLQPCFKLGKGESKLPRSIKFVLSGGQTIKSMGYTYIQEKHYDNNVAIILFCVNATVTIYGHNLDDLYERLDECKVSHIIPMTPPVPINTSDEDIAIITKIDIIYNDPQREKHIETVREDSHKTNSTPT